MHDPAGPSPAAEFYEPPPEGFPAFWTAHAPQAVNLDYLPVRESRMVARLRRRGQWREAVLAVLRWMPVVTAAADRAGVSSRHVYRTAKRDPAFREEFRRALAEGVDRAEQAAHQRAIYGTLRPVYQQGVHVGNVVEYSDRLLEVILRGRKPRRYRERYEVTPPAAEVPREQGRQGLYAGLVERSRQKLGQASRLAIDGEEN